MPFRSSRVFFSRSAKPTDFPKDDHAVLEELSKPHVATLIMTAGTLSMAATRWFIQPKSHALDGLIELTIDSEGDSD